MRLKPYQQHMLEFALRRPYCALWAGMGTGKTLTTIRLLESLVLLDGPAKTLVVGPLRVITSTWPDELAKWGSTLRLAQVTGNAAKRIGALTSDADIYAINYENLPWLVERSQNRWPFTTVILDESSRLKGFGKRAKALFSVRHAIERMVQLTGTPAPQGYADLWAQMFLLDGGERLGRSAWQFNTRFFQQNPHTFRSTLRPGAQQRIDALLSDICLTVDGAAYFDCSSPNVVDVEVDLPEPALRIYHEMQSKLFAQLTDGTIHASNAAVASLKCLQLASGAIYHETGEYTVVHDAKLAALGSIEAELQGAPLLVAYYFKSDLARLKKAFPHGRELRDAADIAAWNAGDIPLLFIHPASAGHGLNLQHGGCHLAFFSHHWNLEHRLQTIERIGPLRQAQAGYTRPVWVYNIIARQTLDRAVLARLSGKQTVLAAILEAQTHRPMLPENAPGSPINVSMFHIAACGHAIYEHAK